MLSRLFIVSLLAATTVVSAAESVQSAIIKDEDKPQILAMDNKTWSYTAAASQGLTKVREFHDMGDAGVQQLDYVANCTTGKLALASFKVLKAMNSDVGLTPEPGIDSLSFYKPVIQHDINITERVCGGRLASNSSARVN